MKINETQEQEIATRLNLTKPVAHAEVAEYMADGQQFAEQVSNYDPQKIGYRYTYTPAEVSALISETRNKLTTLEQSLEKLDTHTETVKLATTAHQQALRDYWDKIEREEEKPRIAFDNAKNEFCLLMEKEGRSLKRRETKAEWGSDERNEISKRRELVGYIREEASWLRYDSETTPEFSEQIIWDKIAEAQHRADKFFAFVSNLEIATA